VSALTLPVAEALEAVALLPAFWSHIRLHRHLQANQSFGQMASFYTGLCWSACSASGWLAELVGVVRQILFRFPGAVSFHKQLIRPVMDYACSAWRSAARFHVRKIQVLQSKGLRLATGAPWYVSNRQIHEDLGVPLFADHIRVLTESFDSKLADVGKPQVRQFGRYVS